MNCKFMSKCTYFEDATEVGGALKQNIEQFCKNRGTDCAFYLLFDQLGADIMLPLNVAQTDIESAKKVIKNENPCWAFKHCPEKRRDTCPAFKNKKGKTCWVEKSTLCQGKQQGRFLDKMNDVCEACDYYRHRKKI